MLTMPETREFLFAPRLATEGSATGEFYNQLLRGMTHKLNNLLAVIQGFSSLIMMNDDLDAGTRENLEHMKEAAMGASGLSERVLSAAGCARINRQSVVLSDYLPMIDGNLRGPVAKLGVPFSLHLAANVPPVSADPGRLKEVLVEILRNAAEAAAESGGEASLDVVAPGEATPGSDRVDIFIRNTGPTIPPESLAKVFEPFVTTKESSHYGIGLTAAAVLSGMMDIPLGIRSKAGTTTVWLQVPVA
jgi:signal transduction histidine kinase